MDMPTQFHRMFRCPRCWHTEQESRPSRTHCPRCGLAIPPPDPEQFRHAREPRLRLRQIASLD